MVFEITEERTWANPVDARQESDRRTKNQPMTPSVRKQTRNELPKQQTIVRGSKEHQRKGNATRTNGKERSALEAKGTGGGQGAGNVKGIQPLK